MGLWNRVYHRAGELSTLLVMLCIAAYLTSSFSQGQVIMHREERARRRVTLLHRLEAARLRPGDGEGPVFLDRVERLPEDLAALRDVTPAGTGPSDRLYTDGAYFYAVHIAYAPRDAESYLEDERSERAVGFQILAWPAVFAKTGELAFCADVSLPLAVTRNIHAFYEGIRSFPPDWKRLARGTAGGESTADYPVRWILRKRGISAGG